jgi:tRNA threonylcarbamoyladenosine biosynthesis protein TsaE
VERADLESHSAAATERAAGAVGRALEPGDVVLIAGDVGTGKTTFVRGACRALGVTGPVTSPSFTIGHVYGGRIPVAHVDLFRLEGLGGEDPALLDDYLTPERVAFVEWPGVARGLAERERVVLDLNLSHLGGDRRRFEARGRKPLLAAIRDALAAPARR